MLAPSNFVLWKMAPSRLQFIKVTPSRRHPDKLHPFIDISFNESPDKSHPDRSLPSEGSRVHGDLSNRPFCAGDSNKVVRRTFKRVIKKEIFSQRRFSPYWLPGNRHPQIWHEKIRPRKGLLPGRWPRKNPLRPSPPETGLPGQRKFPGLLHHQD